MLKPYFIALLLCVCAITSNAQVRKIYLTNDGSKTSDSLRATSYILYQKMEGDSAWSTRQYDMQDIIMTIGTFKDEQFTIPHGKFIYYTLIPPGKFKIYNRDPKKQDSAFAQGGNFIDQTGVYLNGKKNGSWMSYNHQKPAFLYTYQDDIQNGLYQSYNYSSGKVLVEGNFINNVRQGDWNSLSYYGDIIKTEVYKEGKIVKTISYLNDRKFQYGKDGQRSKYDLISYLNLRLSTKRFNKHGKYHVTYSFDLTQNGKLVAPLIEEKSDQEIDDTLISELSAAPNWEPIIRTEVLKTFLLTSAPNQEPDAYNSDEKRLHIPFYLDIVIDGKGKVHISYPEKDIFRYD
ncbi:hypothetical protein SAMN05428975_4141 [Mucilaginibacter sp. OK268]|uniref:toxin-antitoxin system YwqK family antitoxin n=1 Tax=Mucilaginibacter sp. OK268 TaxID=1881048 RepID=UPI00088E5476|nr:hypothetical protein [Mucilaginibacter sp. OK268]SDP96056.1 hypothetical protein SAMN05428975_4141 [Mucilaginibacter sp. OK268]